MRGFKSAVQLASLVIVIITRSASGRTGVSDQTDRACSPVCDCHRRNQLQPRGLCRKFDFEPAPLVLAMILGPQLEASLRRSLIYSRGDLGVFFERPIATALMVLALLMLLSPLLRWVLSRKFSGIVEVSDA